MKRTQIIIAAASLVLIIILAVLFTPKKEEKAVVSSKSSYLIEAEKALAADKLLKAKELYLKAKEDTGNLNQMNKIRKEVEKINLKIIFSQRPEECSSEYTVVPNDVLSKIARKHKTTVRLIKRANGLKSDVIQPGQKLKVNTCDFSILVDKSQNLLFLKRRAEVVKTYLVSTGKDNSTPVGEFKIVTKLNKPTWYKAGAVIPPDSPDNILGSRWLGFDLKGYGIHGTTEPEKLGSQITLGCVRMKNSDVEELYDIVPSGTEVVIID